MLSWVVDHLEATLRRRCTAVFTSGRATRERKNNVAACEAHVLANTPGNEPIFAASSGGRYGEDTLESFPVNSDSNFTTAFET